jgi:hypothetical protein
MRAVQVDEDWVLRHCPPFVATKQNHNIRQVCDKVGDQDLVHSWRDAATMETSNSSN